MNGRRERGAALVEFAIVVPLLLLLVFGAMDIGRLYFIQVSMSEAAQEGALYATFEPGDHTLIRQRVVESLNDPNLSTDNVSVLCPDGTTGSRIIITVEKEMAFIAPYFRPVWGSAAPIRTPSCAPISTALGLSWRATPTPRA